MGSRRKSPFPSRPLVREALGRFCGVLLTDGYIVYERFAQRVNGLVHAQCWSHTRRQFLDAEGDEPALVTQALNHLGALYEHEALLRQRGLEAEAKLAYRAEYAKPLVDKFFAWLEQTLSTQPAALQSLHPRGPLRPGAGAGTQSVSGLSHRLPRHQSSGARDSRHRAGPP
jgi:hypothetical protein